ncbi:hypothetical protein [Kribbella speibonae]|uniref:Uncharacterized protein n=1 Tax=Kribbella speibonae TaxID=1572660 RepID=A0A4R0IIQ8_9ACTN|nr:hypothetical protein [Kribbella speibonae]TCC32044.1 hypothetical protein E0H92_36720 [Kribbella speibonae]
MSRPTFIRQVTSSTTYHPDGSVDTTKDPAVWTLAHRGYSGGGRLDVWVYPTKAVALREGAALAMACGLDEDEQAVKLFKAKRYDQVMERYEATHPDTHLLRVQPAFLQYPD